MNAHLLNFFDNKVNGLTITKKWRTLYQNDFVNFVHPKKGYLGTLNNIVVVAPEMAINPTIPFSQSLLHPVFAPLHTLSLSVLRSSSEITFSLLCTSDRGRRLGLSFFPRVGWSSLHRVARSQLSFER